ncbi:MAG: hypothetical protein C0507_05365 [Cyanobacteria bacterium PR.3.49]|jgi:hypothetical protein|nr:hypothetical protein [Cyanobacteria bacterium PR.3.49]
MVKIMRKKVLSSLLLAAGLLTSVAAPSFAYPERPESARVYYEIAYFPCRLVSMAVTTIWDVPTAAFQDAVKGAIGGTKMVSRNLGKEDGTYELVAGGLVGGPVGLLAGGLYGARHGLFYGMHHGFVGYPSPHSGSHSMIFQGKGFVVPYDDNY